MRPTLRRLCCSAQLDERETDLSNAKAKYGQDLKEAQRLAEEIKARSEQDHAC